MKAKNFDAKNFETPHVEPGLVGKVVTVPAPADFKPSYHAPADYEKQKADLRGAKLYDYLWNLAETK